MDRNFKNFKLTNKTNIKYIFIIGNLLIFLFISLVINNNFSQLFKDKNNLQAIIYNTEQSINNQSYLLSILATLESMLESDSIENAETLRRKLPDSFDNNFNILTGKISNKYINLVTNLDIYFGIYKTNKQLLTRTSLNNLLLSLTALRAEVDIIHNYHKQYYANLLKENKTMLRDLDYLFKLSVLIIFMIVACLYFYIRSLKISTKFKLKDIKNISNQAKYKYLDIDNKTIFNNLIAIEHQARRIIYYNNQSKNILTFNNNLYQSLHEEHNNLYIFIKENVELSFKQQARLEAFNHSFNEKYNIINTKSAEFANNLSHTTSLINEIFINTQKLVSLNKKAYSIS